MRTLILILLLGFISNLCYTQVNVTITEKRNIYNEKGNYYFDRNEFKKAIVFYNIASQRDANDYFSILRKAEAYTKLKLYPQAEECYRIVFESNQRLDNVYRLKYALVLLANNKPEEFKQWLGMYSQVVEEETKGENILVSSENRIKLYKDSTIVIVKNASELDTKESPYLNTYQAIMLKNANEPTGMSEVTIEGFTYHIGYPSFNSQGTVIYFVSDAPGGKGGMDLYSSHMVDTEWTYPENLGNIINSNGDEEYPFIFNDSILNFASDGHSGFGGLDLYSVNVKDTIKTIVNLGNQINSTYDDYGLFLAPGGQTGYFSSNRPGGKENIYKLDILNFKIKYAGYRPRKRTSIEDNQLNLILASGEEYHVAATGTDNFEFSFQPMENYKLIIQSENIKVEDILYNNELTPDQRREIFLNPPPVQKAEIKLQEGMKYQFAAGQNTISPQYRNALKEKARNYQNPGENTINLTALARELQFTEGEIYTVRFVKDDSQNDTYKGIEVSTLFMNDQAIRIYGQSFFAVLPLKTEINFTVQTDIDVIDQNFSSKKYAILVDEGPVFKEEEEVVPKWLLSLTVNTDSIEKVDLVNRLSAKEISIIPGTEYILTLSKPDPKKREDIEVIVPLTRGVKYNLSSSQEDNAEFKETLAELLIGREGLELTNEEVIDISVLSKEIEVQPGEDLSFTLLPVKQFGKKPAVSEELKSSLMLDGKVLEITRDEKYVINVPFTLNRKVNFQTDLNYMQENFEADAFVMRLDTVSFTSEITIDTTGYGDLKSSGWLVSMSVNTDSIEEVEKQNQFIAKEVSIIPGKDYILTVSKVDGETGEVIEIIVPLTKQVKYDFTSNPGSEEEYKESLNKFLAGRQDIETIDGQVIDIRLISKELQIKEGDEISFSLLPVKILSKQPVPEVGSISNLYLDSKLVEFTQIQKFTINVPLTEERQVNMQTDLEHLQEHFEPSSFTLDIDTLSFFSEITIDTAGLGDRVIKEEVIKDPVFDVITINFDLNEYSLRPEAMKTIQEDVIDELKGDSRLYVTIKGYTDALGDPDYNLSLSKKRAESVKEYLKRNGIGEGRIRTFSFGASQLLEKNINWKELDESELRKYRKVEIVMYLPK